MSRWVVVAVALILSQPAIPAPGDTHYVGPLQAHVKAQPSAQAETKFVIAIGRELVEFDREGEWAHVGIARTGGKEGWVRVDILASTDPDGL